MRQPRVPSGGPAAVGLISLADAQQSGGWRRRAHSRRILIGSAWRLYLGVVTTDSKFSGLVDGLHGQARQEREELILWLLDRGFDVDQVRNTLSPILLPANRVFGDDGTLVSARDVADASGVPLDLILRLHRAAGLAVVDDPDKALYTRADAESILPAAAVVDHGIDLDHVVLVVRLLMEGLTRAAVAMRQGGLQTLLRPGATEVELAEAFETLARDTQPMIDPMIRELAWLALRHSFETEAISASERTAGTLPGERPITVAFADVVGFTRLGEALPPEELGELAGRLANVTREVVAEPVHFVKTIGDAVMLVSPDAERLVSGVLELLEAAAAADFPRLRAGVASGLAVTRAGDWYGSPVNIASRVTGAASPGVVLVAESARAEIGDVPGLVWLPAESRHLRGVQEEVRLFRATRAAAE
jgi:adenylate cyclase